MESFIYNLIWILFMNDLSSIIPRELRELRAKAGFRNVYEITKALSKEDTIFKEKYNGKSTLQYVKGIETRNLWCRIVNASKNKETKIKISDYLNCIGINPKDNEELLEKIDEKITGFCDWYKKNYIK